MHAIDKISRWDGDDFPRVSTTTENIADSFLMLRYMLHSTVVTVSTISK